MPYNKAINEAATDCLEVVHEIIANHVRKILYDHEKWHIAADQQHLAESLIATFSKQRMLDMSRRGVLVIAFEPMKNDVGTLSFTCLPYRVPSIMESTIIARGSEAIKILDCAVLKIKNNEHFLASHFEKEIDAWFANHGRSKLIELQKIVLL